MSVTNLGQRRNGAGRRRSHVGIAALAACLLASTPAGAATVFSDGFESGGFGAWPTVVRGADGVARVDAGAGRDGSFAAQLSATAAAGSRAYVQTTLASPQSDATIAADVKVTAEGASGGNVPLVRVNAAGGARILSVFRKNLNAGRLYVHHGGTFSQTTGQLPLGTWGRFSVRVVPAALGFGTIVAKLDGRTIFETSSASIGSAGVATIQLGNEVQKQAFGLVADDVMVTNPDVSSPETTIDSGPSGTVSSTSASFTFSSSPAGATFECRLDGGGWQGCVSPQAYDGLAPGQHTFDVRATDALGATDPTPAGRVWTVAPTGVATLVGAGDIAGCGHTGDEATASLLDDIPGTVFTLGDHVYPDGTAANFADCYGPSWGRHKDRTRPVAGNHDYPGTGEPTGYFDYFGASAGDPAKGYYSYDLDGWHVVALNTNCAKVGGCGPGSPQEQWLRQDLAANEAECTLAMWHEPRFSSGSVHGSNALSEPFWQALYEAGADLVLAGHDHHYERFARQDAGGQLDATYGLRQIIVGTGGKGLYPLAAAAPNSQVRDATALGVLKLTLRPGAYDWEFVPVAGQSFTDAGSDECHAEPPPPPTGAFTDGFESGDFRAWTSTARNGDGVVEVQSHTVKSGTHAARLSARSSGSYAYARHMTPAPETELETSAWFMQRAEGNSGGNVPLLRLFDVDGTRIVSLYRQNQASDKVYVNHSGGYFLTSGRLPLNRWSRFVLKGKVGASDGVVEVWQDGTLIYRATSASLGTKAIRYAQIGNNTASQPLDLIVDDFSASATGPPDRPDPEAPDTVIDAGPSGSVADTSAVFAFSASEPDTQFECRSDGGPWSVCTSPMPLHELTDGAHTFDVRARDAAGNVDPTPATRSWTIAFAGACNPSAPLPTNADPGDLVVADNFERGLGKWKASAQGDGTVVTQNANYHRGRCAARMHVTTRWDSRANVSKTLPSGTRELWSDGWFNFEQEGADGTWNTPTFRMFSNGRRVLDFSRQNQRGDAFVRYPNPSGGSTIDGVGHRLALRRWYHVRIHAVAAQNLSLVEVWLDDALVYRTTAATLGTRSFDVQQIGAEHQKQVGDTAFDDVVVKAIAGEPTDVDFEDGFESGDFTQWTTTYTGGNGTLAAQTDAARSGAYAARMTATAATGSAAYIRKTLPAARNELTASADLRLAGEGPANTTLPLLTLNDAGGNRVASVIRANQTGRLSVQDRTATYPTEATLPLNAWAALKLRIVATGAGTSTVEAWLDDQLVFRTETANLHVNGAKVLQVGSHVSARPYDLAADSVVVRNGPQGPPLDDRYKLLIADLLNRRLLITDFNGRVVWKFDNPTGTQNYLAGPVGLRWLPGNRILATFASGEVGVIDVATKSWVWQVRGFAGELFQSPYDAELLPDGKLAVAMRYNNGGRVSVYDRGTGQEVWQHRISNAHSVNFRPAEQSYGTENPTLLVGGWGATREVEYLPSGAGATTWEHRTEYTHEAMVVEDDKLVTLEGYYFQKLLRNGTQVWRRSTPDEIRRIALNPNAGGGYVDTLAEGDRIEFRDAEGNLLRDWAMLSDGSSLDYPYGIQVIEYPG